MLLLHVCELRVGLVDIWVGSLSLGSSSHLGDRVLHDAGVLARVRAHCECSLLDPRARFELGQHNRPSSARPCYNRVSSGPNTYIGTGALRASSSE